MEHSNFTYVFEDDRVLAFNERKFVASASSIDELETKLATEDEELDIEADAHEADQEKPVDEKTANVITTPNGLRGKIMGRAKDIWGDTVTVRFDNGNIRTLPVTANLKFANEEEESVDPVAELAERYQASYARTEEGLKARKAELDSIREAGRRLAKDHDEAANILVQAEYEKREIDQALEHIASSDVDAYVLPKREYVAVEQASVGRSSNFVDSLYDEMQREAAEIDYDKLMGEGPESFVAELDDSVIANVPTVRELVSSFLEPKIAMADKETRDQFEDIFQARVEAVRRNELTARKASVQKQAAAAEENVKDAPDEALFG